jgi:hypothetical protein
MMDEAPEEVLEEPEELGGLEEETPEEPSSDFDVEADAVFNTALPMSERRTALKNAIMSCIGTDYGKEESKGGGDMLTTLLGKG